MGHTTLVSALDVRLMSALERKNCEQNLNIAAR